METSSVAVGWTPRLRFGTPIGAAEVVLGVGKHQPMGALRAAVPWLHGTQLGEALLCSQSSMCGGDPKPRGQAKSVGAASPPAFPPPSPGTPASPSALLSPLSLLLLLIPPSLSLPFFPLLHPPPDSSVGH